MGHDSEKCKLQFELDAIQALSQGLVIKIIVH